MKIVQILSLALIALLITACGSGRATIEGYTDDMLMRKRVFVLLPADNEITMVNEKAYAYSRGVGSGGGRDMLRGEMRSSASPALDAVLDSNTVLDYRTQPVGSMVEISIGDDLQNGTPVSWEKFSKAGKEGNIDYMVVLYNFSIDNTQPSDGEGRGDESIKTNFSLLDLQRQKVMKTGLVEFTVGDPRMPIMTYKALAKNLVEAMPFWVQEE